MAKEKANYEPSAATRDLEERQDRGNENIHTVLSTYPPREEEEAAYDDPDARDFTVEDNETDAYLGVAPEYQNYGSDGLAPLRADGGPEAEVEAVAYGEVGVYERPDDAEGDGEDELPAGDPSSEGSPAPSGPVAPSKPDSK